MAGHDSVLLLTIEGGDVAARVAEALRAASPEVEVHTVEVDAATAAYAVAAGCAERSASDLFAEIEDRLAPDDLARIRRWSDSE